ncbi:unnamed protein product [Linum trigynum]|uniref:Uncharacterized protein n=1 Tax=Linum trigynum TaxID=586398 RepID=A0AAV2CQ85_9ROSI
MAAGEPTANASSSTEEQLKLAVVVSFLRSKLLHKQLPSQPPQPPDSSSGSDVLRWKRKAKDRKQEIARLRERISRKPKMLLLSVICFPKPPCYFFDHVGKLRFEDAGDGSVSRFNDVLRRSENEKHMRRNRDDPSLRLRFPELSSENEVDQLRASVDFLVELCASPMEEANFANWSHQAVDSFSEILGKGKSHACVRYVALPHRDDSHRVAPLITGLNSSTCCVSWEVNLTMDSAHFFQSAKGIQLIEFLVSDHLQAWSSTDRFNNGLMEGWVASILSPRQESAAASGAQARALYVDRVANELAKQVCRDSSFQKLNHQLLDDLFN